MSRLLEEENELLQQRDRELTLGAGAILAIFLGLVLVCGVFFGFGYNLGHRSTPPSAIPTSSEPESEPAGSSSSFDSFKTSPSSPAPTPPATATAPPAVTPGGLPAVTVPAVSSASPSEPASIPAAAAPKPEPAAPAPTHEATTTPRPTPPPTPHPTAAAPERTADTVATPPAAAASTGPFVVQVAAVSHKDDADLLVGALHAKGYDVAARNEPQDKLLHIQIGPFTSRKDADAMRQRLIDDGYNAIVK
jgi:DedD protein